MSNFHILCEPLQNGIISKLGWRSLTLIQEMTIPEVINGKNLVLLAPTAGGKTEAAFFPILHNIHTEGLEGLSVIYVSPIKALLNNQEERLNKLSSFVYRNAFKWHGDVERGEKEKYFKEPSGILMITPESLEVILLNKRIDKGELFKNVRSIVIDEIHSFADGERGVHLMAVLERIQEYSNHDIQRIGLSATVGNPEQISEWLQGSSKRQRGVIDPPKENKPKKIEIKYVYDEEQIGNEVYKRAFGKKALLFSNSRTGAEGIKNVLQEKGIESYVHHSSINKYFREVAEEKFKLGKNSTIIATSTLELGIDIGDLDVVLQLDSPYSVSSFLQRMGRTGRRKGSVGHFVFFPTKEEKLVISIAILNLAMRGWVENVQVTKKSFDLMFHQILMLSLAYMGINKELAYKILTKSYSFSAISQPDYYDLLNHMLEEQFIQIERNNIFINSETEKKFGRSNFMELYTTFETNKEFTVRFKNRTIGTLERWYVNALGDEFLFTLAGAHWQTLKIDYERSIVYVEEAKHSLPPRWMSDSRFFPYELAQEILKIVTSEEKYNYLNSNELLVLSRYREELRMSGLQDNTLIIEERKDGYIFTTYAGNKVNYTIANSIRTSNNCFDISNLTWKGFKLKCENRDMLPELSEITAVINHVKNGEFYDKDIILQLKEIVPDVSFSKYQKYLPSKFRKEQSAEYVYDIDTTLKYLNRVEIKGIKDFI
ncbi:DEAD/DEAH box helicase [Metabacillus litoralis]|uniref:DEAD/DEAH box helicase n=1 Tax=Metabacillus litoralis TaxID=152268 RepID=UPI000EF5DD13|nr:DEAD/DEAH box helicase [Metabacillus litoralis]